MIAWSFSTINHHILSFYIKYIKGNVFSNAIISSNAAALAHILSGMLYKKAGPRILLVVSFSIAIVFALLLMFLDLNEHALVVFVLGMKAGTSLAYNSVFLAAYDAFPTKVSASIFGLLSIIS